MLPFPTQCCCNPPPKKNGDVSDTIQLPPGSGAKGTLKCGKQECWPVSVGTFLGNRQPMNKSLPNQEEIQKRRVTSTYQFECLALFDHSRLAAAGKFS